MRAACMCFSVLQAPSSRVLRMLKGNPSVGPVTFGSTLSENFHTLRTNVGGKFGFKLVGSNACGTPKPGPNTRRWNRLVTTKVERKTNKLGSSKPGLLRPEDFLDGTVTVGTKLDVYQSEVTESKEFKSSDVQLKVEESKKVAQLVTILVFDVETTGLSRENESIIEFALRDLSGGKNSTFQTLINPEREVPNTDIHGISTRMVNRPDVPRFADLIPILLHYVQTRQIGGGPILWVAHNARAFDVPFLIHEFGRCGWEIPPDWQFLDTILLARELGKSEAGKLLPGKSLQALREFYKIPLVGNAHRAMSDVDSLSEVLKHLTFDLKLPVSDLLERSFKASDITSAAKKKKKKTN